MLQHLELGSAWAGPAAARGHPGSLGASQEWQTRRGREQGWGGEEAAGREDGEGEAKKGEGKSRIRERQKSKWGRREAEAAKGKEAAGLGIEARARAGLGKEIEGGGSMEEGARRIIRGDEESSGVGNEAKIR